MVRAGRLPRLGCSWLTRRPPTHPPSRSGQPGPRRARRPRPAREGGRRGCAPRLGSANHSGRGNFRPRRAPQRPAPAATGSASGHRLLQGGARPRHGAPDLGVSSGEGGETSWMDRRRGRMETGAGLGRFPPPPPGSLCEWNVPDAAQAPSPHTHGEGSWGLPARLPASPLGRAPPPPGSAHVGGRGFGADARAQAAPASSPACAAAPFVWDFSGVGGLRSQWDDLQGGEGSEENSGFAAPRIPSLVSIFLCVH